MLLHSTYLITQVLLNEAAENLCEGEGYGYKNPLNNVVGRDGKKRSTSKPYGIFQSLCGITHGVDNQRIWGNHMHLDSFMD